MRLLLAAMTCGKGAHEDNLAAHIALLERSWHERIDLVVLPEMSLTGSVDPATHPEHAVALDDRFVERLVDATWRTASAMSFGLAERYDGGFSITQVLAADGVILGVQRKRVLGEGEEPYTAHADTARARMGTAALGTVICAEAHDPTTWTASTAAGEGLVLFAAAPGLHGRRTDAAGWREGLEWWESTGLADAQRAARTHGVWVAVATQAGATHDEDFPGLAALVSPDGAVVERLPDERPGTLVVDVPIDLAVLPVRRGVRVIVLDGSDRTLLARFGTARPDVDIWVPPGGGLEAGEDDLAAARRELFEELGRDDLEIGPLLGHRAVTFLMADGRWLTQEERWYVCRCDAFDVDPAVVEAVRAEGIEELRWWTADELRRGEVLTGPRDLADLLDRVTSDDEVVAVDLGR